MFLNYISMCNVYKFMLFNGSGMAELVELITKCLEIFSYIALRFE